MSKAARLIGTAIAWLGIALCVPGLIVSNLGIWLDGWGEDRARSMNNHREDAA